MNGIRSTRERLARKHKASDNKQGGGHAQRPPFSSATATAGEAATTPSTAAAAATAAVPHKDVFHNLQTPCCRLMQEAAVDIFPCHSVVPSHNQENDARKSGTLSSSPLSSSSSMLGRLIRAHYVQHVVEQQQQQQQQEHQQQTMVTQHTTATTTPMPSKKKRKRKRKKHKTITTATTSCSNDATGEQWEGVDGDEEQQQQQQQQHDNQEEDNDSMVAKNGRKTAQDQHTTTGEPPLSAQAAAPTQTMSATAETTAAAATTFATTPATPATATSSSSSPTSTAAATTATAATAATAATSTTTLPNHVIQHVVSHYMSAASATESSCRTSMPTNRTLPAFVQYLCDRQQQQQQQQSNVRQASSSSTKRNGNKTNGNSNNGSSNSSTLSSFVIRIPLAHVQASMDSISCLVCKQAVHQYYDAIIREREGTCNVKIAVAPSHLQTSASSLAPDRDHYFASSRGTGLDIPIRGQRHADDSFYYHDENDMVDRAFDYVAMEEGRNYADTDTHGCEHPQKQQEEDDVVLSFVCTSNDGKRTRGGTASSSAAAACDTLECHDSLTMERVNAILMDMILTHGLMPQNEEEEDDVVVGQAHHGNEREKSNSITTIIDIVTNEETNLRLSLCEKMALTLSTRKAQIDETLTTATLQIDVRTSSFFQEIDADVDKILHQLLSLLRTVFAQYDASLSFGLLVQAASLQQRTHIQDRLQDLSVCTVQTVSSILNAQTAHTAKLAQLAQRPGSVPMMALNAQHRNSYRSLLQTKVAALQGLRREMETQLLDRLLYRAIWTHVQFTGETDNSEASRISLEFWNTCEQMTHNIPTTNVEELKNIKVQRTQAWRTAICAEYERLPQVSTPPPETMTLEFDSLLNNVSFLEGMIITGDDESARDEAIPKFANSVFLLFQNVLNQWLYRRRVANEVRSAGVTAELKPIVMPLKLKRFMRGQSEEHVWSDATCQGGGARRRVTGIVAGLFYQWLQDRCNEWHAELTRNELLESMMDEPIDKKTQESKTSKSKKSKKKKGQKIAPAPAPAASQTAYPSIDSGDNAGDVVDTNPDATEGAATAAALDDKSTEKPLSPRRDTSSGDHADKSPIVKKDLDTATTSAHKSSEKPAVPPRATISDVDFTSPGADEDFDSSTGTENKSERISVASKRSETISRQTKGSVGEETARDSSDANPTNGKKTVNRPPAKAKALSASVDKSDRTFVGSNTTPDNRIEKLSTAEESIVRGRSPTKRGSGTEQSNKKKSRSPRSQALSLSTKGSPSKTTKSAVDSKTRTPKSSPRTRSGPSDASVDVGVVSLTGFQSSEGFLVQRLVAVLHDERKTDE